jgi:aminopeptidase N
MDEGVTCYAEARISQLEGENKNYLSEAMSSYNWVRMMYPEEPISTAANHFDHDYAYYNAAYYKGQLFPELIRYMIGDKNMKKGFHRYYANWKFKHPEPNDFVKTFEDVSQMELTWFQNYWLNTTKTIDFGIDSVKKSKNALSFTITREGVPLPVEFSVELKDGTINYYYIPLDLNNNVKTDFYRTTQSLSKWSCGEPNYSISLPGISIKEVLKITLDPDGFLPDVFMENNSWPIEKE